MSKDTGTGTRIIWSSPGIEAIVLNEAAVPTCPKCNAHRFVTARWEKSGDWILQSVVCENGHQIPADDLKYSNLKDVADKELLTPPELNQWGDEEVGISFSAQFEDTSDRDAVILASIWFEDVLADLISLFSVDSKKANEEMILPDKPLSTFSARTKFCYFFGLISQKEYHALNSLRKIRNEFAHELLEKSSSLENGANADRVRNIVDHLAIELQEGASPRSMFHAAIGKLYSNLVDKLYMVRRCSRMPLNPYGNS